MLEQEDWEGLISRAELSSSQGSGPESGNSSPEDKRAAAAARAIRMTREGACSKAVQSLQGGMRSMDPAGQETWATELLPQSRAEKFEVWTPGECGVQQPEPDDQESTEKTDYAHANPLD